MGQRKRPGPSTKSVAASKSAKKTGTKSKRAKKATVPLDLPPRPRKSRRVKGLPPEAEVFPPERPPDATGLARALETASKSKSKHDSRRRLRSPPSPYPGHNTAAHTTLPRSSDDTPKRTESYIDKATQSEHKDTTGEKATQTEHQDVARATALIPAAAQFVYGDPIERWIMNDSQSERTAVAVAPAANETLSGETTVDDLAEIESIRGLPAYQPSPSNPTQRRKRALTSKGPTSKGPTSKAPGSSTGQDTASVPGVYKRSNFRDWLEQGSSTNVQMFMEEYSESLDEESVEDTTKDLLESLKAESHQPTEEERYKEEVLKLTVHELEFKNEPYVIAELHDLVCPPVERLSHIYHRNVKLRTTYRDYVDLRNEAWRKAPQLLSGFPSPMPDYCVGFRRSAFVAQELALLATVSGSTSSFAVTERMYFPFLTCEVKSHKEPIATANKQNAYSMMVAVSCAMDLFRAAKVEQSVHRKVLGFSISYDHKVVVAYGYYPVIVGPRTQIYRTPIFDFNITSAGSDKWQSWQFVRNIYEVWAPEHRQRLVAAIRLLENTADDAARPTNRDEQTPTPSEAASRGLQQLGLQSPRLQQLAREDSVSVLSDQSRRRRAMTAPVGGDASPKRQKSTVV